MGVTNLYGPEWTENYEMICTELGDDACQLFSCGGWVCEPTGVKNGIHWMQNTFVGRMQEYAPNYFEGEREAPIVDLASIDKVPISLIPGTEDKLATYKQALETADIIGRDMVNVLPMQGWDHAAFSFVADEQFMGMLMSQLQVDVPYHDEHMHEHGHEDGHDDDHDKDKDSDDAEDVVSELYEMIADLIMDSAVSSTAIATSALTVSLVAAVSF